MSQKPDRQACSHNLDVTCAACDPHLQPLPKPCIDALNARLYQINIESMLRWKKAYYTLEDYDGKSYDVVPDSKYDAYEEVIKRVYPAHPILAMVDYDEAAVPACLAYIPSLKKIGPKTKEYLSRFPIIRR